MKGTFFFVATFLLSALAAAQNDDLYGISKEVDSLIERSRAFTGEQKYEDALSINQIAERLALEKAGEQSEAYGHACFNHGRIMHFTGNYKEAERWYLESWNIFKDSHGELHPGYAQSLSNLMVLYNSLGDYENGEKLFLETKKFREQALALDDPVYAYCFHGMANLTSNIGRFEVAESLYLNALSLYEQAFGKESNLYTGILNDLADLYMKMGKYEQSENLYIETLRIQDKTTGKESNEYALALFNMATLQFTMGNFKKAEPSYSSAKSIWEKGLGKEHPYYALCLNNLAALYLQISQFEKAENLYNEALTIRESTIGATHPDYALSLSYLAVVNKMQGRYGEAESLFIKSREIYVIAVGKEHPDYASITNKLGDLYLSTGDYKKAEELFKEALKIRETVFGLNHPNYLNSLQNLAELYALVGNEKEASLYFNSAAKLQQSLLGRAMHHLSEQELGYYESLFKVSQNQLLSYVYSMNWPNHELIGTCYDDALYYKGFLLNAVNQIGRLALWDKTESEKYYQLKAYKRRLAEEYSKPIDNRTGVTDLEEKANLLEKELARQVTGFGEAVQQVTWQKVQQNLRPNEAAVEFMHFRFFEKNPTDSILYAALLLKSGQLQPEFIPLFEEKSLESLLYTDNERKADYVNRIYTTLARGAKAIDTPQQSLYEMLWAPLEEDLQGISKVYFSPTGLLHRLNLGAIPIDEETTIADHYQLIEMGSTRQLVIASNPLSSIIENEAHGKLALLYGGIGYDLDTVNINLTNADEIIVEQDIDKSYQLDPKLRGGSWNYLRWTESEISALSPILQSAEIKTTIMKGHEASEESFKNIGQQSPSPQILHIATHGYFFPDPVDEAQNNLDEPVFKTSSHPMIRSGLLLAGANYAWQTGKSLKPGMDDGILTAYEISQMDLSNTELVVLSACETGLGDIQGNEGVYGLQRAFKIAGAKYLIMSLWQVPDRQTSILMTKFYEKWLEDKMTIPDAFHAAQKELRDFGFDPYQWAGFVLVE